MTLDSSALGILVLVALVVGIVGVAAAVVALVRLASVRRSYALLEAAEGRETFVDIVARTREDFADLRAGVEALDREVGQVRVELAQALRHVSVVRYDAFGDLGGRFSFSAASAPCSMIAAMGSSSPRSTVAPRRARISRASMAAPPTSNCHRRKCRP